MGGIIVRVAQAGVRLLARNPKSVVTVIGAGAGRAAASRTVTATAPSLLGRLGGAAKRFLGSKGRLKDIATYVGIDYLIKKIWPDGSDLPGDEASKLDQQRELSHIMAQLAEDELGYSDLRSRAALSGPDKWNSAMSNVIKNLINKCLFRVDLLAGESPDDSLVESFMQLSDHERMIAVTHLSTIIKIISASGDARESILLGARQALCSVNPNPVLSKGANIVLGPNAKIKEAEDYAVGMNGMYEGLVNEIASSSMKEMFDEGSDIISDIFDWSSEVTTNELSLETNINAHLSHLVFKGQATTIDDGIMGAIRSFSIDSDGLDDESMMMRNIQDINAVLPSYRNFVRAVISGEQVRADDLISG